LTIHLPQQEAVRMDRIDLPLSLTDDERRELSDKVRDANKRSETGSGRR
jgi:hypothetical protein